MNLSVRKNQCNSSYATTVGNKILKITSRLQTAVDLQQHLQILLSANCVQTYIIKLVLEMKQKKKLNKQQNTQQISAKPSITNAQHK